MAGLPVFSSSHHAWRDRYLAEHMIQSPDDLQPFDFIRLYDLLVRFPTQRMVDVEELRCNMSDFHQWLFESALPIEGSESFVDATIAEWMTANGREPLREPDDDEEPFPEADINLSHVEQLILLPQVVEQDGAAGLCLDALDGVEKHAATIAAYDLELKKRCNTEAQSKAELDYWRSQAKTLKDLVSSLEDLDASNKEVIAELKQNLPAGEAGDQKTVRDLELRLEQQAQTIKELGEKSDKAQKYMFHYWDLANLDRDKWSKELRSITTERDRILREKNEIEQKLDRILWEKGQVELARGRAVLEKSEAELERAAVIQEEREKLLATQTDTRQVERELQERTIERQHQQIQSSMAEKDKYKLMATKAEQESANLRTEHANKVQSMQAIIDQLRAERRKDITEMYTERAKSKLMEQKTVQEVRTELEEWKGLASGRYEQIQAHQRDLKKLETEVQDWQDAYLRLARTLGYDDDDDDDIDDSKDEEDAGTVMGHWSSAYYTLKGGEAVK